MDFDSQWRPEFDYYQILGVAPGADHGELQAAFGRRAKQCHPDRGGSHAEMVLLNEAWEVLSNPDARRRYDEILAQRASRQTQEAFVHDVCEAKQKAEAYPTEWPLFEQWLNGVAQDFTKAKYGSIKLYWPFDATDWPTAGDSLSGRAFIMAGAACGVVLILFLRSKAIHAWPAFGAWAKDNWGFWIFPGLGFMAGGARFGVALHGGLGLLIEWFVKRRESGRRRQEQTTVHVLTNCRGCGQRIRLPKSTSKLVVTCPTCRCRFSFGPSA